MQLSTALYHITGVSNDQLERRLIIDSKDAAETISDLLYEEKLGGGIYGPISKASGEGNPWYEVSIYKPIKTKP